MSSPSSRRMATPRRTSQRSSQAPQSSPLRPGYGPEDQLRAEASQASDASQSQETPRANRTSQDTSQDALASSPLFFQSSPVNGSTNRSATNGLAGALGMSSPLRQSSAAPDDGARTPRASGQTIGGKEIPATISRFAQISDLVYRFITSKIWLEFKHCRRSPAAKRHRRATK